MRLRMPRTSLSCTTRASPRALKMAPSAAKSLRTARTAAFLYRMVGSPVSGHGRRRRALRRPRRAHPALQRVFCSMATQGITAGYPARWHPAPSVAPSWSRARIGCLPAQAHHDHGRKRRDGRRYAQPVRRRGHGRDAACRGHRLACLPGRDRWLHRGRQPKTFRGDQPVTRQDMAAFLGRLNDFIQEKEQPHFLRLEQGHALTCLKGPKGRRPCPEPQGMTSHEKKGPPRFPMGPSACRLGGKTTSWPCPGWRRRRSWRR